MPLVDTELGQFSFLPVEGSVPFEENLEWRTDITPTYDGGESRVCLLQRARQSFEASYPAGFDRAPAVFNTVYGSQVAPWLAPHWGEAQFAGDLAAGAVGAAVGNAAADLRQGGLALLWGARGAWQVVQLDTVAAGAVTFAALPAAVRGAYLLPLRQARLGATQKNTRGHDARWSVTYEVEDTADLAPAAPEQYLDDDIYYDENILSGEQLNEKIFAQLDRADYGVGRFTISTPWDHPRVSRPFGVFATDAAEAWDLRLWLHRRQGRYRAFWQPSFESDLRLAQAGAVADTLTVRADAWDQLATARVHLAVETLTGWLPRAITAAVVDGDNVHLTLSSALNVDASAIRRISYLGLRRLDSDRVSLSWLGNGCCHATMKTVELTP